MLKKKFKSMVALCLCLVMVLSIGIGANAGYNDSFDFSISPGTGNANSTAHKKATTFTYASVTFSTINFSGSTGELITVIRDKDEEINVTSGKTTTQSFIGSPRTYTYKSGHGVVGTYYKVYGSVASSAPGSARLAGQWAP